MSRIISKNFITLLAAICFAVMVFISLPGQALADEACEIRTWEGVRPCIVVNNYVTSPFNWKTECILENIAQDISGNDDYCKVKEDGQNANLIVFQPKVELPEEPFIVQGIESGSTITRLDEPVSFSLSQDQRVIISGGVLKVPLTTIIELENEDGDKVVGWPTNTSLGLNEKNSDPKSIIKINDIPIGKSAITVSGGTLVLRNLFIEANCDTAGACGSVIKLTNGAKLIIDNSQFVVGHLSYGDNLKRYLSFIEIDDDSKDNFSDYVTFVRKEDSDEVPTITSYSKYVFKFSSPKFILSVDFADVKFEHIGTEVLVDGTNYNYIWDVVSNGKLIDIERVDSVKCQARIGKDECIVDNSSEELKFNPLDDSGEEVVFLEKDSGKMINGGKFVVDGDSYQFTFPDSIEANKIYAMTNLGQRIHISAVCPGGERPTKDEDGNYICDDIVGGTIDPDTGEVECDAEFTSYDEESNACVCTPQNTELSGDECKPLPHHEWQDEENKDIGALPECKGSAVPINYSEDRDERCVCPNPEKPILHWSPFGISSCLAPDEALPSDDTSDEASSTTDSSSDSDSTETGEATVIGGLDLGVSDNEEICLTSGGTWIGGGLITGSCEYPEVEKQESTAKSGSYGCSLTVATTASPIGALLILMGLPMGFIIRRRLSK